MDFNDNAPLRKQPGSSAVGPGTTHSNANEEVRVNATEIAFADLLRIFYAQLFPFREFYRWLNYGGAHKNYFAFRELSFTLANDAYLRFKSFNDNSDLKKEILTLCPVKIDIGAVYNARPKDKKILKPGSFNPMERELVFDIDMTDYDPIRSCCSGADICRKCWSFMTVSIQILDRALKEDFGFKHRLWVYSGRRGVHCWVCDEKARKLTVEARRAIVNYLEVVKGGEEAARKVNLIGKGLHPSLRKAHDILDPMFTKHIIHDQDILTNPEKWRKIVALIPDEVLRSSGATLWEKSRPSPRRFVYRTFHIPTPSTKYSIDCVHHARQKPSVASTTWEILFQYSYPRLDSNVSIGLNHLLKSPFCVHPKTGRVCIPIDPQRADQFDPFSAPKLADLVDELAEFDLRNPERAAAVPGTLIISSSIDGQHAWPPWVDYQKTSMKAHVDHFRAFVEGLEEEGHDILRARRAEEEKKLIF
ncbi:hypothetical protein BC830DRAFT_1065226 [Chytriomyces sp. MP71]|nr:hypothetical protein BC830DRAFT_1065226 [Chytriomyces sp. MP71]